MRYVMVAQRADWTEPPKVVGLTLAVVGADAPTSAIQENMTVNERGFDPKAQPADAPAAEAFRAQLAGCAAVTGYWCGQPVAAGMFKPIHDGRAELAGITTLAEFRRRGFGGAVTARLTRAAFEAGAHTAFAVTEDEAARRVYHRMGYREVE